MLVEIAVTALILLAAGVALLIFVQHGKKD